MTRARVRDQVYLPAGSATDEEVLLRLRQLETGYRYRMLVGFSFQFGSIYNNVVNPAGARRPAGGFRRVLQGRLPRAEIWRGNREAVA